MPLAAETFRDHAVALLDYWRTHAVDREFGGFRLHLDRDGALYDEAAPKHLVGTARAVYSFSRGALIGGPSWCQQTARHGVDFLLRHFRDTEHGGWFRSVNRDGSVADGSKHTYGHNFVMLALAELHRATGDHEALRLAEETFDVLEAHAWDPALGAYRDAFDRTWSDIADPALTQNTHIHNLEAMLVLHDVTGHERYRRRVADVCRLLERRFFDRRHKCCHEAFRPDWTIDRERNRDLISVGHQFEWTWFLMQAEPLAPKAFKRRRIDQLMTFALRHGWDHRLGGAYTWVTVRGEIVRDHKGYWETPEAVIALLWYARRTGKRRYEDLAAQGWAFCTAHLCDRAAGGWFDEVTRQGDVSNPRKGGAWRAGYHETRACSEIYRFLKTPEAD